MKPTGSVLNNVYSLNADELLASGISQLQISITSLQLQQLLSYVNLIIKWNKVFSLTAIKQPQSVIIEHLLDGIAIAPFFTPSALQTSLLPAAIPYYISTKSSTNVLDVGSGMGVPGIILAIVCPWLNMILIDSNHKKISFLRQIKIELQLTNLQIIHSRVEHYTIRPHIITARACAELSVLIQLTQHLQPRYYALMKSTLSQQEIANAVVTHSDIDWYTHVLTVPFLYKTRYLLLSSNESKQVYNA